MKGYRISLIRHGLTKAADEGRYIGITNYPLSEEGRALLSEKYDSYTYPRVQKVYTSPLRRCEQTAQLLFPSTMLQEVDDLREMDFGAFEGKTVDELIGLPEYKEWLKGGADNAPPDGESVRELMVRCFAALDEVLRDMMQEGLTHCAVVTHSGIITNMLSCFGLPKYSPEALSCKPGEGFEILVSAQMWQLGNTFEILGRIPDTRPAEERDYDDEYSCGRGFGMDEDLYDEDDDCDCGCGHHHEV